MLLGLFESEPPKPTSQAGFRRGNTHPAKRIPAASTSDPGGVEASTARLVVDGVTFEFPPRLRKTWRLVRRRGGWVCEVPRVFEQAPPEVQKDLELWVVCALRPSPGSRAKKKAAQIRIFQWLSPQVTEKLPVAGGVGETWDLQELFDSLNQIYFGGCLQAVVRWSPKVGGVSTHRKVEVDGKGHHVLTISRAYDGPTVPWVAVAGVLYHEMCHIVHPPRSSGVGRRRHVHHPEFRKAERSFDGFEAWRSWESQHLHRELRKIRKRLKSG